MSVELLSYREHDYIEQISEDICFSQDIHEVYFKKEHRGFDSSLPCFTFKKKEGNENKYSFKAGYFIGVDWVVPKRMALNIAPKLNNDNKEIDYIAMLFSSLRHKEVAKEINELFDVKWDDPVIEIEQKQDLLTPFLVVEFLGLLKQIVRKGLKKSYYKVEKNLHSRVKGKIQIGKTIKHNLMQNKNLHTYCTYNEFGLDNIENRLLKKALSFVKRYLPNYTKLTNNIELQNTFNFINPAFHSVSDVIELNEIKQSKKNAFYKEYEPAIRLAKLILKRFGYNISNTVKDKVQTPPFWIDMSKLFELYVLGLLKDRFQNQVQFQCRFNGNEIDYLLKDNYNMVIDAKYKSIYIHGMHNEDIRQLSGYARLEKVYEYLGIDKKNIIDCLIIYPDQDNGHDKLNDVDLKAVEIDHYFNIYKVGLKLPHIE